MDRISRFEGEYEFLSNFYPARVILGDQLYPTVEHAYQAAKTLSEDERELIHKARYAGTAKKIGQNVKLRSDWEQIKEMVMADLLEQKFADPELRDRLLSAGRAELIEGNSWHDNYWGVCQCADCRIERKPAMNRLGVLLMQLRDRLFGEGL